VFAIDALNNLLPRLRGQGKKVVAVAAAADAHVLESAARARELGIADFALFGDVGKIKDICAGLGVDHGLFELVQADTDACAASLAVSHVARGKASAIMKGLCETSTIIKAALDKEHGIRASRRLSHMAMFALPAEFYHKPLYVTDAAVNIAPDFELMKEIIENAVNAVKSLGLAEPKVALIAAKEKSDPKMPVTLEFDELTKLNEAGWLPGCSVRGPLALDCAVSLEAAKTKGLDGPVIGDADIIFCPDIEAGNVLYKSLTMFTKAAAGGVILGAKAPVILTSRSDSAGNKLLSIALGALIKGE